MVIRGKATAPLFRMSRRAAVCVTVMATIGASTALAGSVTPQPKMGAPLDGLTPEQMQRFLDGQVDFNTTLLPEDGLGPIFNKESCGNCHNNPLGGAGTQKVTRFGASGKGGFDPLAEYGGSLLQHSSISIECAEEIPEEANIIRERVTNGGAMGYGLIEAIPSSAIEAIWTAQPMAQKGRIHWVEPFESPGTILAGRFGHKAQVATLLTFSADAALNEMGLTNRFLQEENDPNGIRPPSLGDPDFCDTVPDPEDGPDGDGLHFIDRVTNFQRFLAIAPQTPRSGMVGETHFNNLGCAVCHTPSFTTADEVGLEDAIRNRTIRPYSDFLLHDMGQAADGIDQGGPAGQRWMKTAPLAGIRQRTALWHDGRFEGGSFEGRVELAIEEHGALFSQSIAAATAYAALLPEEKDELIAFIGSLGRLEFDSDADNDVQLDDFLGIDENPGFSDCYGGGPYDADDPCAIHDIDQDGDVDLVDFDHFLAVYEDPIEDCNANTVPDLEDILVGTSFDGNANGIPDECEPCEADVDGNGMVDVDDLIFVITAWGDCPPKGACEGDTDDDGDVDVDDLITVIIYWGLTCN